MARVKKPVITGTIDKTAAQEAFAEFAKADARQKQITSKMDVEMTKIREKYADDLAKLTETKDANFEKIQSYAENNRDEFGNKKSMELAHGVIGFRTGTPEVKTQKGFTWPSVTKLIKSLAPDYLRTKEEPAKDKLLADRFKPEMADIFDKIGVQIMQSETFYVEPKKEEIVESVFG